MIILNNTPTNNKPTPVVLTVAEAGELLRLSRRSAYKGVKTGEIPTIRVGRRILVPRVALDRMLETAGGCSTEKKKPEAATSGSGEVDNVSPSNFHYTTPKR